MSAQDPNDDGTADDSFEPTLENLLEMHREVTLDGVRICSVGTIVDYNAATQSASVQPLIQHGTMNEDSERVAETLPVLHDIMVKFSGNSRGRITYPVAAGDPCVIWWSASSLSRYLASGAQSGPIDPGDDRRHDISDAVCEVGGHDFAHVPTDAPTNSVCVHLSGGTTMQVGSSSASHPAALGDELQTELNIFLTALSAYIAAIKGIADPTNAATPVLTAAINAMKSAVYSSNKLLTDG